MTKHLPLIVLTALALAGCGGSDKTSADKAAQTDNQKVLSIYNWSEYVDPETVAAFEKKHGITVTYDVYDSDETLESKVLTGKSGYDIVGPSNAFVGRQIKAGAYQKIDKSLIPNYKNLNPQLMKLMEGVDPGHEYAVPFYWGTNTFAINTERVKKALGTDQLPDNQWDLVFNPEYTSKLKQCGISYLDSAAEIYPMVLNYMGKNPNSSETADIKAATEVLKKNRPYIKRFTSSGYIDDMAAGNLCVAIGYGGDLNIAKNRAAEAKNGVDIQVLVPRNGVGIWVDSFMIPRDAENVGNALAYINYTLEPEVAAKNGSYVTYAPASQPARKLMDAKYADDASIFPSKEIMEKSFIVSPKSSVASKLSVRLWQGLKAGR